MPDFTGGKSSVVAGYNLNLPGLSDDAGSASSSLLSGKECRTEFEVKNDMTELADHHSLPLQKHIDEHKNGSISFMRRRRPDGN